MRKAFRILAVALVLSLLVIPAAFADEGDVYIGNVKFTIQQLLTRAYQDKIDEVFQEIGGETQQVGKIEYAGGKLYTLGTVADAVKSRQPGQALSEALEGKPTTATPENPVSVDEWSPRSVTVTLADTASGIGKVATVSVTGYEQATQYRLLKADGTALTNKVSVGGTVVVLFLNPGDTCQVELYEADGTLLATETVVAQ